MANPGRSSPTQRLLMTGASGFLGGPLSQFAQAQWRVECTYVEDVAAGLLLALNHPGTLLHLGGPERLSRYEFGLRVAEVFGLDAQLIQPCRQADVAMAAARPADVSANSQRAVALGYQPRGVWAGLEASRQRESL